MSVPVAPADRVEALDVLRGVALFGVLTVTASTDGIEQLLWMVNPAKNAEIAASA